MYGGRIFTQNIRANRFAGAGAQLAARGARDASKALDTYIRDKQIEDAKEGTALAMRNEALPEGASAELAEQWYGTKGQNDGHHLDTILTDYRLENPNTTADEVKEYAKSQIDAYIKDMPDAYAIGFGSRAIPIVENTVKAMMVKDEEERRQTIFTDRMVKFKNDMKLTMRDGGEGSSQAIRNMLTDVQTEMKALGYDRIETGKQLVSAVEAYALEHEDLSAFEAFELQDKDGVRMLDVPGVGNMIIDSESRVEKRIEAAEREKRPGSHV